MKIVKNFVAPTLILGAICLIATLLLGITNDVTAPEIEKLADDKRTSARKEVFETAYNFDEDAIKTNEDNSASIIPALDENGNIIGYVVENEAKGYGGAISVMTGVDLDGKVTGVSILSHSETAGLGAKAKNEDFRSQFIGLIKDIAVSKDRSGDNTIDALTGATVTSRAVVNAVNEAIDFAAQTESETLSGGENNG